MASNHRLGSAISEDSYALSPMQEGMLYHSLNARHGDPNLIQITGELRERIDPKLFALAWARAAERHDVLRTSFHFDPQPHQRVSEHVRLPFCFQDLTHLSPAAQEKELDELGKSELRPFDLNVAPLTRIALVRCAQEDHRLLWTVHHLVADAQSFAIVLGDVFDSYAKLEANSAVTFPEIQPYRRFVEHTRQQRVQEEFWRSKLADLAEAPGLELPRTERVAWRCQQLDLHETLTADLRRVALENQLTLTTLIHGAWALLLARYTGQEDAIFGVVRAGRRGFENTAGLRITTLPLRVRVSPNQKLIEWLKEVRGAWRELSSHEHVSLAEIHRCSGVQRQLFDTLVSVQDPPWDDSLRAHGEPWGQRTFRTANRTSCMASLDVYAGTRVRLNLEYTDITDVAARRLVEQLSVVLTQMATEPERQVRAVNVLTREELGSLEQWNATAAAVDLSQRVDDLVANQSRRTPEALAVRSGAEQLTYRELNDRAERLATRLRAFGLGPDIVGAVYMERSADMVVALLAVMKAGGAYVPIDPGYPQTRVEYMIGDAQAAVVLTHRKLAKGLNLGSTPVLYVDSLLDLGEPHDLSSNGATAESLAYIIYTSGSTGRPKGVAIEHRSLLNLVQWHQRTYKITSADRATQIASAAFDAAVWELWPYLTCGASVHIADEETRRSPARLAHWLNEERMTVAFLPTPLAEAVMDHDLSGETSLRLLLTGGDQLRRRPPPDASYTLVNHYGPTENTVVTTAGVVSTGEPGVPSIGRPIANVQVHVLDTHLQPVPLGVAGELCISGAGLARGYWQQSKLTAERFVTRPDGKRIYRTGDLVRFRGDGELEFLGRLDTQVKIRGHRIETGEIECVLRSHSAIIDAAVAAQADANGAPRLVGYVVTRDETTGLREYLRESLPDYMVPDVFVPLAALPMTANGKLDRRALPRVEFAVSAPKYVPPRNAKEDVLAGIWSDVLNRQQVGIDDNFFALGGHSLSSMQVLTRARSALGGATLPLNALFKYPTIRELAEQFGDNGPGAREITPHSSNGTGEAPLSFAQERLWFFEQLEPGKPVNNIAFCLEIDGPLDIKALERAANKMVRRHGSLRTAFLRRDGRPAAVESTHENLEIVEHDLTKFPESERERAATPIAEAAARDVFDLGSGTLVRLQALRFARERHWLILVMHHIGSDGWSMAILYRELRALYQAELEGGGATLPSPPIQYPDFARWQREQFERGSMNSELAYWRAKLAGKLPVLDLPADRPRPPVQSYKGASVPISLDEDLTRRLEVMARHEDVTLYMLLLAAFKAVLHRYSGQEDLIVGTPVAGRSHPATEDLIGMFVNTLPIRTGVNPEMPFRELLHRVRETALEAYAHQQLPFEKLVEALQVERDLSRSPVFQVMFAYQNTPSEPAGFKGTQVRSRAVHTGTAKYDLTISLEKAGDVLSGYVEFSSDLFNAATMERFCGHYLTLLRAAVANPDTEVGRLPLLTETERHQIVTEWNATATPYPLQQCIHELFEEQAHRTPQAIAAVFEDQELTYAELNQRANGVAARLRNHGVGPESLVGICLHRSLEMLVGLIGILKAGAAYVPLDPAYPAERLALMVEDARLHALLADENTAKSFDTSRIQVLHVETTQASDVEEIPASGVTPDNLAYVIYTSGSTGKPKGVMIRHRNVVNFFTGMDQVLGSTPGVWLAVTSICFDISVLELLWTVTRGFKVVIQADQGRIRAASARSSTKGPCGIAEQIRRHEVTHFQCTPSLMGMLLQEPGLREAIESVGTVLLGGEALTASLLDQLKAQRVINMYGPTETTVWSTCQVIESRLPISIGRPIANTSIYVLDRLQQPTPVGVPGELHIGGAGVVRGYLNRPELTAERFVPNPFATQAGEKMYRTGDLARYRSDGTIEYLGRLDHQVKLRGHRIELGEIEAALRQVAGVRDAVVVVRELGANDKRLAAYLTSDKALESAELRRALKEKLPDYMVPSLFTLLSKMPLTPNGKIDRNALPDPDGVRAATVSKPAPPQSAVEQTIVQIWRELLQAREVGLNDNFFDLGGHSLLMVQAQARISAAFGIELPIVRLFQHPTVSALAKLLGNSSQSERVAFNRIAERARRQRQAFGHTLAEARA